MTNSMISRRGVLKGTAAGLATTTLFSPAIVRAAPSGTVYVESWGGTYAEAVKNYILEPFKEATGVDYKHGYFGNNSEQLAKLKTGKSRVDMTFMSDSYILRAAKDDALVPITIDNVPNYRKLFESFQNPVFDPDAGNTFCASYFYGDQAIAYNEDLISETPESWEILWDSKYQGHVVAYGSGTGPVYLGAHITGQDINNITDLDVIEKRLMDLKPNLLKWWTGGAENTELFATGEAWIGDFWRGRVNNLRKEGHPIGYVQPKEGTTGWVDTMAIPSTVENREAAEALINFALEADVQKNFVLNGITYAPTNSDISLTDDEAALLGATEEILSRTTFVDPIYNLQNIDAWTEMTNRVKA